MSQYEQRPMNAEQTHACNKCRRLCPISLALAAGIVGGLGPMLLGWSASGDHWGAAMVQVIGSVYNGFAPTMTGALWGGLWGFLDGFISGLIFALVYNSSVRCFRCKRMKSA